MVAEEEEAGSHLDALLEALGVFDSPPPQRPQSLPPGVTHVDAVPPSIPEVPPVAAHASCFTTRAGLRLQLSLAGPLCHTAPPSFVLYILDPYPELFALTCADLLGRGGYDIDGSPEASPLRQLAIVGIGHDPADYSAGTLGWNVEALRALRRRDFLFDRDFRLQNNLSKYTGMQRFQIN